MTILVIGANGKIGQALTRELALQQLPVRALLRSEEQAVGLHDMDVEPWIGDLEGDFRPAFIGIDRVVFTAGSGAKTGFDKTLLIDLWAAVKAVQHAAEVGVRQFVMVSSRGAGNPDLGPARIKPYLCAKFAADQYLLNSDVPYTIVRPGRLTDEPASQRYRTDRPHDPEQQCISRANVVQALVYSLTTEGSTGRCFELFDGELPLAQLW